jgi:flagellar assembly protein FliH
LSSAARSTLNPKGQATAYAQLLKPLSQLDLDAKQQSGGLREKARQEAVRAGFEQGFQAGFEQGQREAAARFEDEHRMALAAFVDELNLRADRLEAAFADWVAHLEAPLAGLATVIAARVLARELQSDPAAVVGIAKQALAEVTHASEARIRVNPFDSAEIEAHRDALLAASSGLRRIDIVNDPSILGGCLVETDGGSIDARVESMLEQALAALRGSR